MFVIIPLTFSIDVATYAFSYIRDSVRNRDRPLNWISHRGHVGRYRGKESVANSNSYAPSVSVIVPAYNEEDSIERTVRSLYDQTLMPKSVIVIDDCSTDRTPEVCLRLLSELRNNGFIYVRREKNSGKASNINYIVEHFEAELGEITVINDSDTLPDKKCIEILARNFTSDNIAAVTPFGYTTAPKNWLARALHYGMSWNNIIFKFRKRAQSLRGGVAVVCGACTAYRTKVLRGLPIPERTKTEDTDYTWLLQENKYKVVYDEDAVAHSTDLGTAKGLLRQWLRWYSGSLQSLCVHGRQIFKARILCWTMVLPALIESLPYALGISSLPVVIVLNLTMPHGAIPFFGMTYVAGFLISDFLFTTIPTIFISPKYLRRLPEIYLYKYVACTIAVYVYFRVIYEMITGQQNRWGNTWARTYGS
jgi:cellulose synthase/poly-beta-1,6-N-acetylglucosamine synthase-like glycosyltransferase